MASRQATHGYKSEIKVRKIEMIPYCEDPPSGPVYGRVHVTRPQTKTTPKTRIGEGQSISPTHSKAVDEITMRLFGRVIQTVEPETEIQPVSEVGSHHFVCKVCHKPGWGSANCVVHQWPSKCFHEWRRIKDRRRAARRAA